MSSFSELIWCLPNVSTLIYSLKFLIYLIKMLERESVIFQRTWLSLAIIFFLAFVSFFSYGKDHSLKLILHTRCTLLLILIHIRIPNSLFLVARLISSLSHLTYEGYYKVDEDNQVILERMFWTVNMQLQWGDILALPAL